MCQKKKVYSNGLKKFGGNTLLLFPSTSLNFPEGQTVATARKVKSTEVMHIGNHMIPLVQSQIKFAISVTLEIQRHKTNECQVLRRFTYPYPSNAFDPRPYICTMFMDLKMEDKLLRSSYTSIFLWVFCSKNSQHAPEERDDHYDLIQIFQRCSRVSFSRNSEVSKSAKPQKISNLYLCNIHESWVFP